MFLRCVESHGELRLQQIRFLLWNLRTRWKSAWQVVHEGAVLAENYIMLEILYQFSR